MVDPDTCESSQFPDCLFTILEPPRSTTITTSPDGLSIETPTRTEWKSNTVITTTDRDHNTIILPVFAGCP